MPLSRVESVFASLCLCLCVANALVAVQVTVLNPKGAQLGCTAALGQNETDVKVNVRCNPKRDMSATPTGTVDY